jgi:predicted ATPase/class 3 adenylate cyclase
VRPDLPAGTVTFLFTDVEGSTKLLHELGAEAYAAALAEHRRIVREACGEHGGVEVDTQGDAFFVAFPTASGALLAARAIGRGLSHGPIRIRSGVHTGAPLLTDEGYVGHDVHRAARIAASGHGGQVLVSAATAALVGTDDLRDLGEHRLKDLAAPERVYQLGEGDFPALKSLHRTNLPVPANTFVGREAELAEVVELLGRDSVRLLTLTGPGGTGKTRLAVQAAAEAAERFPDGITWVPLAPLRDPALLLPQIAEALGVKERADTSVAESLTTALAGKHALLVLDNAEHLLPALASDVATLASTGGPLLLVTSRERLQLQAEWVYPVPTLSEADGVSLFLERVRALEPSFAGNGVVAELCARLDNLPLALELAAARSMLFSPEQLLERIGQRLDLLRGGRDADPRQHTLRATIAWSYDLLDEEEGRLLRGLSVFAGGCAYEAAEEVCDAEPDTLQSLVDKSLVRRRDAASGPRYWLLEMIREFAAEELERSDEAESVRRRHAEFHAALAETAERELPGADQEQWWRRVTDEHENMRVALAWACDGGESNLALRLAANNCRYWWQRGHYREGRHWYEKALDLGRDEPESLRARAVYGLANMAIGSGAVPEAVPLLEDCLASFRKEGDDIQTARTLTDLGMAYGKDGQLDRERAYFEEALEVSRACGWMRGVGVSCINLGNFFLAVEELDRAAPLFAEALATLRDQRDEQSAGNVLNNIAYLEHKRGRLDEAAARLHESIALSRRTDDRYTIAHSLVVAAALLAAGGDGETAAGVLGSSASLQEEMALVLDWVEARLFEETATDLRASLGDSAYEAAWQDGHGRPYEEVLDRVEDLLG